MLKFFLFALKQLAFWLIYFLILQGVFLFFFRTEISGASFGHIFYSFLQGFRMNVSAAAYFTSLSVLLVFISSFKNFNVSRVNLIFILFILICCSLINITDMALYQSWGSRINGKALWYLQFPGTVGASAGSTGHIKYIIAVLIVSGFCLFIYKTFFNLVPKFKKQPVLNSISFLLIGGLLFIALRGGSYTGKPISRGSSYYSKYPALNYAAVNGFWNFFDIVSHYKGQGNPYKFFGVSQLEAMQKKIYLQNSVSVPRLTNIPKPNILFVFIESWGADVVGCLGGQPNVTTGFDNLANEGLLFTNFYSTGFRTEQGLMAVFSGFPAQAQTYPMEDMERFENYPNLIREFSSSGYYTSYFTGGNPEFANTDVYLKSAGIDKVNDELLGKAKRRSAWGALDEETFDWVLISLNSQTKPFFSSMVTLTSHEWFEAPVRKVFIEKDKVMADYKNTVRYTDSCLHDFMEKAKKQPWYNNTLIFIMADHACSYPMLRTITDPERYHIPMMISGGALKPEWKGKTNPTYGGHLNIPALVGNEAGIDPAKFKLSTNMLANDPNTFAYFTYDHGLGVIAKNEIVVYDMNLKGIINPKQKPPSRLADTLLNYGKFIMQSSAQMKEDYKTRRNW